MSDEQKQAVPHSILLASLMNPNIPKNEREHAAVREINRITTREKQLEDLLKGILATPAIEYIIGAKLNDEVRAVLADKESKT